MTVKTWQERLEETATRSSFDALHASIEEIQDAMQAEIDELRKRLQAWESQESVEYQVRGRQMGEDWSKWDWCIEPEFNFYRVNPEIDSWEYEVRELHVKPKEQS